MHLEKAKAEISHRARKAAVEDDIQRHARRIGPLTAFMHRHSVGVKVARQGCQDVSPTVEVSFSRVSYEGKRGISKRSSGD